MDKFLIASNPMVDSRNDVFILHALRPMFLIRCIKTDPKNAAFSNYADRDEPAASISIPMEHPSMNDKWVETWVLVGSLAGTDINPYSEFKKMDKIIARAARWFRSYRQANAAGHHVDF